MGLPYLLEQSHPEDVIVVNFGLWHHDNPQYWCAARPGTDSHLLAGSHVAMRVGQLVDQAQGLEQQEPC